MKSPLPPASVAGEAIPRPSLTVAQADGSARKVSRVFIWLVVAGVFSVVEALVFLSEWWSHKALPRRSASKSAGTNN